MEEKYLIVYSLISRNIRNIPHSEYKTLHLDLKENEGLEEKVNNKLKSIVNDSHKTNEKAQIHGVYKIDKEEKLENYIISKDSLKNSEE